ncbi:MAG: hypothetical protein HY563_01615 [Ignavibacteriales bacterium]|nr:hypothetical protein [Ignavibacteriales bacterium]
MKQWYAFLPAGVLLSFGVAGSLAAGIIAEGNSVLRWTDAAFQYLVLGSAVSFVFVAWKHKGLLESTTYALSLALFCAIPAREDTVGMFIFMSTFLLFACAARTSLKFQDASFKF